MGKTNNNMSPKAAIQHSNGKGEGSTTATTNCCAKVMVFFRPSLSYKGEFGFDWVRGDDVDSVISTSEDKFATASGTVSILDKEIVGKYPNQDPAKGIYPGTFVKDANEYKKLCKIFIPKQHHTQSSGTPLYNTPVMTIFTKQKVTLELKLHIIKPAKGGIQLRYDSELFKLSPANILNAGKGTSKISLSVECLKEFDDDQYIKVTAGGKSVGQLKVLANSKQHMYTVKIALVDVRTNFTSKPRAHKDGHHTGAEALLTRYLKQAYVVPQFESVTLDVSQDILFNKRNVDMHKKLLKRTGKFMQADLDTRLYAKYDKLKKDYRDYYRIYFIDEQNSSGSLYGQSAGIGAESVFVSSLGLNDSTAAHELFHAMGLYHTFDKNSEFVFKQHETDNIMDYSDVGPKNIQVNRSASWQWNILQKSSIKMEHSIYEKLVNLFK